MKRKIFMLLSFVFVTLCLSAQSLVFHLPDGGMSTIKLPATFTVSPSGDKLIIESTDARVELEKNRILAMIYQAAKGDVNDDTKVDVADIATVIDIMAGKGGEAPEEKAYTTCPDDHHPHLIDLGLPSGTKWACCNVGASTPEGYGNYYAWGETSPKSVYNWDTYKYGSSVIDVMDIGSDIAGTGYDAATANWGSPWRMPSLAQIQELLNNTTHTWTTQNGVNGRKFTGSNGGTVFLPAAGYRWDSGLYYAGSYGDFWSSSLLEGYPYIARYLGFHSGGRVLGQLQPRPRPHGALCALELPVHPFATRTKTRMNLETRKNLHHPRAGPEAGPGPQRTRTRPRRRPCAGMMKIFLEIN